MAVTGGGHFPCVIVFIGVPFCLGNSASTADLGTGGVREHACYRISPCLFFSNPSYPHQGHQPPGRSTSVLSLRGRSRKGPPFKNTFAFETLSLVVAIGRKEEDEIVGVGGWIEVIYPVAHVNRWEDVIDIVAVVAAAVRAFVEVVQGA